MAVNSRNNQDLKPYSIQHIQNQSFNQALQLLMMLQVGFDGQNAQLLNADALATQIDYNGGTNPIYIGIAAPGSLTSAAVWQIQKLAFDGNNNITAIQYAGASPSFNQIYDNRASLSYS